MSFAISTTVTLKSGKKVEAFYLDDEGLKLLQGLPYFKSQLESLESQVGTLRRLVKESDVVAYFEKQIMENLPSNKSVRSWDLMKTLRVHHSFYSASNQAWENLLAKGKIQDRGSGWYRKKGENQR